MIRDISLAKLSSFSLAAAHANASYNAAAPVCFALAAAGRLATSMVMDGAIQDQES